MTAPSVNIVAAAAAVASVPSSSTATMCGETRRSPKPGLYPGPASPGCPRFQFAAALQAA